MGKKQKRGSKQATVPHRDAFTRINYLLQASLAVLSTDPARPELSRFYIRTMKNVSKRLVLRMDPSVKRMLCKSCDTLLVPGVTCTHRIRARREQHVVVRCLTCGRVKRFLARRDYQLWAHNPTNVEPPPNNTQPPPTTNTQPPATNTDPPTTTTEPPTTNTETPATDIEPPATNIEPSATNIEPSATNSEPPATNTETPATNTEPPTTNTEAPATNTEAPATNTEPPSTNTIFAPSSSPCSSQL